MFEACMLSSKQAAEAAISASISAERAANSVLPYVSRHVDVSDIDLSASAPPPSAATDDIGPLSTIVDPTFTTVVGGKGKGKGRGRDKG